jgi:hypothetical protein
MNDAQVFTVRQCGPSNLEEANLVRYSFSKYADRALRASDPEETDRYLAELYAWGRWIVEARAYVELEGHRIAKESPSYVIQLLDAPARVDSFLSLIEQENRRIVESLVLPCELTAIETWESEGGAPCQ